MVRQLSLVAVMCLVMIAWSLAADPAVSSVEQARQLAPAYPQSTDAPATDTAPPPASTGDQDDDSFGSQQILKGVDRVPPFDAFASVSAFFTNNVALTHRDTHSDSFLTAAFGLSTSRKITDTLELDLTSSAKIFRYARFSEFDLDSLDVGVGLTYRVPKLWDASLYASYGFSDLLNGRSGNEFFDNHDFTLGVEKTFGLSRALNIGTGLAGDANVSDPKVLQENSISSYAGIDAAFTRHLEAHLLYHYAWQFYTEGTRRDNNHLLSLSLEYTVTNWLSIAGTTFLSVNDSNEEAYSYEVLTGGLGINANIGF